MAALTDVLTHVEHVKTNSDALIAQLNTERQANADLRAANADLTAKLGAVTPAEDLQPAVDALSVVETEQAAALNPAPPAG